MKETNSSGDLFSSFFLIDAFADAPPGDEARHFGPEPSEYDNPGDDSNPDAVKVEDMGKKGIFSFRLQLGEGEVVGDALNLNEFERLVKMDDGKILDCFGIIIGI